MPHRVGRREKDLPGEDEVRDLALAQAVATFRPPFEVAVAGLCDTYCPAGRATLVTPVFLLLLVELAARNAAAFIEELLDHGKLKASLRVLDRGEVRRKKEALVDSLTVFCQGRAGQKGAEAERLFVAAFGAAFTPDRLYATQVAGVASHLGGLMAGIRAHLVDQLAGAWTQLDERRRKIIQDVEWKKEANTSPGRRDQGGRFKAGEPAWQGPRRAWPAPQALDQPRQQPAEHGVAMGMTQPQPQGGRGGGRGAGDREGGRGPRIGAVRDVDHDVPVPGHLEPKVREYNERARKEGRDFLCVWSSKERGGCKKPDCRWIHPQSEEAWAQALKGL